MPAARRSLLLIGLLVGACSAPSPTPADSPGPTPSATAAVTADATSTVAPAATSTALAIADDPGSLALVPVASGLDAPISIASVGDDRLLVNERVGRVQELDMTTGSLRIALDITDRVGSGGERGLLGLAMHPAFPTDRRAFVHYTGLDGGTVLSEFTAGGEDPITFDPGSERVLLEVAQPYANHNGGQLAFGPDGMLYLGLGDGGAGGDPHGNGQDPAALLGSILRLDVSGPDAYAVPSDNPFADGGGAPEVFVYGLRNPWRFSFDAETGQLWIADVGQSALEEIDRLDPGADAGANLGWSRMEGTACFAEPGCASDGLVLPVTEYGRDLGCSVTGGYVSRGTAFADLHGWYVFGDYCTGAVFGVRSDTTGPAVAPRLLLDTDAAISSFGEGSDGMLYLADLASGTVYRIVDGD